MESQKSLTNNLNGLSSLSCETCRRRKAKCDRKLPSCDVCESASLDCTYPSGRLRPGPKTGSKQKKPRVYKKSPRTTASNPEAAHRRQKSQSCAHDSPGGDFEAFAHSQLPMSPEMTSVSSVCQPALTEPLLISSSVYHTVFQGDGGYANTLPAEDTSYMDGVAPQELDALLQTGHALNISPRALHRLIDSYFENMTTFSLFHQPTFMGKLREIGPSIYLNALLAAMFSFSARFEIKVVNSERMSDEPSDIPSPEEFHQLALRYEEEALMFCRDEIPPLCFLQAITLTTFYEMTKSVRGRAWRWLGTCIRLAYELNLHLVDAVEPAVPLTADECKAWVLNEERRRIWWAVWELDNFACTLRQLPSGINSKYNRTWLPIDDESWFKTQFHPSSYLAERHSDRWKWLQSSKNESPTAWLIVVNSLTRETQETTRFGESVMMNRPARHGSRDAFASTEIMQKLTLLSHSLQCTLLALPDAVQYHNEYLNFSSVDAAKTPEMKKLHSAKYNIFVASQVTRFLISHHYTFGTEGPRIQNQVPEGRPSAQAWPPAADLISSLRAPNLEGLVQYVEAADNITLLLNRCSGDHVRYVNPFLASTIWVAAAAQLLQKRFGPSHCNGDLVDARFDILRLAYTQFIKFWDIHDALLQMLDALEKNMDRPARVDAEFERATDAHHHNPRIDAGDGARWSRMLDMAPVLEPNLTGSGQNPIMQSLSRQHDQRYQPGSHTLPSEMTSSEQRPDTSYITGSVSDQVMDGLELTFDLDGAEEFPLPMNLNNLLSGSFAQGPGLTGMGPMPS